MRTVDGSRSLSETAESGLEATGAAAPVTAVLDIIEGLKGQDQVFHPLNAVQVLSGWQAMLLSQELPSTCCEPALEETSHSLSNTLDTALEACQAGCLL